jgi:cytochrome P450
MTTSTVVPDALLMELVATPEGRADPYPRYAGLRAQAPVHRSAFGLWTLTGYDDCQQLLRHPGVGKDFSAAMSSLGLSDADREAQDRFRNDRSNMLVTDPPDHTRLRGLVTRAFTNRTVERLRPRIVTLVDELLDTFDGEVEVMDALAFPLPVTVIGDMLGVPAEDRPALRPLVRKVTAILELAVRRRRPRPMPSWAAISPTSSPSAGPTLATTSSPSSSRPRTRATS